MLWGYFSLAEKILNPAAICCHKPGETWKKAEKLYF